LPRRAAIHPPRHPVGAPLARCSLAVTETEKDGVARPTGKPQGCAHPAACPLPPSPFARILPYPLTELTGRKRRYRCATCTARARARNAYCADRRSARTAHILLHMRTSRHAESAARASAGPPAAIYYRARCLVQFTYDYADATRSAPTYAHAARARARARKCPKGVEGGGGLVGLSRSDPLSVLRGGRTAFLL